MLYTTSAISIVSATSASKPPQEGLASWGKIKRINRMIRDVHADGYEPIFRAAWGDTPQHTETVKLLLEEGRNECRVRLCAFVGTREHAESVKLLLEEDEAYIVILEFWNCVY
jgi:hypothetical protein